MRRPGGTLLWGAVFRCCALVVSRSLVPEVAVLLTVFSLCVPATAGVKQWGATPHPRIGMAIVGGAAPTPPPEDLQSPGPPAFQALSASGSCADAAVRLVGWCLSWWLVARATHQV